MGRINRVPEYDLQKHLINGKRGPQSGAGIARDVDDDRIDREDPMEFTAGDGIRKPSTMGEMLAATMRGSAGLDSGISDNGQPMDVKAVSNQNNNEMSETSYGKIPGNR